MTETQTERRAQEQQTTPDRAPSMAAPSPQRVQFKQALTGRPVEQQQAALQPAMPVFAAPIQFKTGGDEAAQATDDTPKEAEAAQATDDAPKEAKEGASDEADAEAESLPAQVITWGTNIGYYANRYYNRLMGAHLEDDGIDPAVAAEDIKSVHPSNSAFKPELQAPLETLWKGAFGFDSLSEVDAELYPGLGEMAQLEHLVSGRSALEAKIGEAFPEVAGTLEVNWVLLDDEIVRITETVASMQAIRNIYGARADVDAALEEQGEVADSNPEDSDDFAKEVQAATTEGTRTIRVLLSLYTRGVGGNMDGELKKYLASLSSGSDKVDEIKTMGFQQAAFHMLSVLNGVAAIWSASSDDERLQKARERGNEVADISRLFLLSTQILGGTVSAATLMTAAAARAAGHVDEAGRLMALSSRGLRVLGQVGAAFQMVYGVAVLVDPDSTQEDRFNAVVNIGMGTGGALGLVGLGGIGLGLTSAAVSLMVINAIFEQGAQMRRDMLNGTMGIAYRRLSEKAEPIVGMLQELADMLAFAEQAEPNDPVHLEIHKAYQRWASDQSKAAGSKAESLVAMGTTRPSRGNSLLFQWRQPGFYKEVNAAYAPWKGLVFTAMSPSDAFTEIIAVLQATAGLMKAYPQTACEYEPLMCGAGGGGGAQDEEHY